VFIFIPLLCFIFIWFIFILANKNFTNPNTLEGTRHFFLQTAIITGLLVLIITELLSYLICITFTYVLLSWGLVFAGVLFILFIISKKNKINIKKHILDWLHKKIFIFKRFSLFEKILLFCISIIILLVAIIGIIAPPNNWDSMTYHMSRVVHWIQNKNVNYYPTNIPRQLNYPPWAEYAIMHLQILSHSDRFANLIQWLSMLGCIIATSQLSKIFGAKRKIQIATATITASIPMGILQGSSTQNDYVTAFWLICFIYFIHQIEANKHPTQPIMAGISLGLCFLSKGTGYIYALPFLIFFSFRMLFKDKKNIYKMLLPLVSISLIINSGYYLRNIKLNDSLLPSSESTVMNKSYNAKFFLSNIIQNSATHLRTPFPQINKKIENSIYSLHSRIGIDLKSPSRPAGIDPFHFPGHPFHEDHAGNLLHFLFIVLSSILLIISKKNTTDKKLFSYFLTLAIISLCFNHLIQWNLFQSRYHLPLFILCSPFVAIAIDKKLGAKPLNITLIILIIASLPWLLYNQSRPLIGKNNIFCTERTTQYFTNRPYLEKPYRKAAIYLKDLNLSKISLFCRGDDWEYPFWILFNEKKKKIQIEHGNVSNISKKYKNPLDSFIPDSIIDVDQKTKNKIFYENIPFIKTRLFGKISIFVKDTDGSLPKVNLLYHFKEMFKYAHLADSMTIKNNADLIKMLHLRKKEFNEAQLIDIETLSKIDKITAEHFQSELFLGLQVRISGYATNDKIKINYGETLIKKWKSHLSRKKTNIL